MGKKVMDRGVLVSSAPPAELVRFEGYAALWREHCFRVISLNSPDEAAMMFESANFEIVAAKRSFEGRYGKQLVGIVEALRIAWDHAAPDEVVGLMNADIFPNFDAKFEGIGRREVHLFCRLDISPEGRRIYHEGFDLVLMRKWGAFPTIAHDDDFAFGVPWWDLWLPLGLENLGMRVVINHSGAICHELHEQRYSIDLWRSKRAYLEETFLKHIQQSAQNAISRIHEKRTKEDGYSENHLGDSILTYLRSERTTWRRRFFRRLARLLRPF
jgi:hypothetical protein